MKYKTSVLESSSEIEVMVTVHISQSSVALRLTSYKVPRLYYESIALR